MRTYFKPFTLVPLAFVVALTMMMAGCAEQNPLETEEVPSQDVEAPQGVQHDDDWTEVGQVVEDRIEGITLPVEDGRFTGQIELDLDELEEGPNGTVLASGEVIGRVNGERINRTFEDVELRVFDQAGNLIGANQVGTNQQQECQILFLELGPIFLDLLGLVVEVPEPIVVEIRAERGPGNLLGNLLCGLVGILDPQP